MADLTAWRALVDKELAGASFDKLVHRTPEGLTIQPLYTEAPAVPLLPTEPWLLCVRVEPGVSVEEELRGGAEAIWCRADDAATIAAARGVEVLVDGDPETVTTLGFHDAGADAADEIALGLAGILATLRRGGRVARLQVGVGRDTFGELCKLRALRLCANKVLTACGVDPVPVHAVCSGRTMTQRDPWVNLLRVTTQTVAAALGGARWITPRPFDAAFAEQSPLGRRVARNTALVLREESQLGRVMDPAAGSYYVETRTDALAREAWTRFQALERGGVDVEARLTAARAARAALIAKRKEPILGVTEFANTREELPGTPAAMPGVYREAEAFEALRDRVGTREVSLILLGPPAEHRARRAYAEGLFAVAGLAVGTGRDVVCLCGSDERYAVEAVAAARAAKAGGARRVVLAGRPGALEAELRAAGVDAFVFVGCDVLATLTEVLS
jgi:methylmalonyl-CoA mutase